MLSSCAINSYFLKTTFILILSCSAFQSRIAVPNSEARKLLKAWSKDDSKININHLRRALQESNCDHVVTALNWVVESYPTGMVPQALKQFFRCLSSSSPVCSYLPPSDECLDLAMKIFEFDLAEDEVLMTKLQKYMPIFFDLVVCLLCKQVMQVLERLLTIWDGVFCLQNRHWHCQLH